MEFVGKRLALVLWGKDYNGEDEVSVHTGTVREAGSGFILDRGPDKPQIELRPEWLARVRPVPGDLRSTLLNADFSIPLTVQSLPDDADPSQYQPLGLRIPRSD